MHKESSPPPPDTPPDAPPAPLDAGRTAWLTVAGAWMVQFATFGYVSAFGVYQDYYTTTFLARETSSNIRCAPRPRPRPRSHAPSWIGSLQLCLMYAPGVFVGRAFDKGLFHHIEIVGGLLYVFSIFMLSLARPGQYYQVFLAQAVGMGLGLGLTFLPSLSIVSHHLRRRRALAVGIVTSGASAGGIVFPILLNRLIADPRVGFANAVRISGALVAALLIVANAIMRTRAPPKQSIRMHTDDSWLAGLRHRCAEIKAIICDAPYLWSILGAFLTNLGVYVPLFYLQLFAEDHGVDARITTYCLAILNAGSTLGRLLPPSFADRTGVYNMLLPAIAACAALAFAIFGATSSAGVILVGLLFGFASGAYISLIPSLLVALCNNLGELGVKMGLAYTAVALAMLVGTPIAGALLGTARASAGAQGLLWWRAIIFTGVRLTLAWVLIAGADHMLMQVCTLAGLLCMTISRTLFARRKGHQRI
ncbi:MFS general substrate transporter [Wolfiporia cocos MD-104 SS10]|uniref:MFS general substrate transporter n=1 Tax=Wolfiporia cocos (strain MD-104) TaxID=742152 RepID=A0A2H3J6P5_WOLCO|nr:MFS general substrate transporter [Wolfiporia cocos MD-104 SS10]